MSCLCNPITINTFVVFVRLYWFEKRFRHIVTEATSFRRNKSISRVTTLHRDDQHEPHRIEGGFAFGAARSRRNSASALKPPASPTSPTLPKPPTDAQAPDGAEETKPNTTTTGFRRDIVFADELPGRQQQTRHVSNRDRVPEQRSPEQHVAFLEAQQNPINKHVLRIPSPRDVELGKKPEKIDKEDAVGPLEPRKSNESDDLAIEEAELKRAVKPPRRTSSFKLPTMTSFARTFSQGHGEELGPQPYLSYTATIGRNSKFIGLTDLQKEELGGIEFRALKTLRTILIVYNVFFSLLGVIIFIPWIVRSKPYGDVVRQDGQSITWWGIFTPVSMFTDLGFTLTPDSMISFQRAATPLMVGSFLIIAGNTGFPCLLRLIIWIGSIIVPVGSGIWEELIFLLDHPRRCFTLLFPRTQTWYLFCILIGLNAIDLIFFVILDLHDPVVTNLPGVYQFVDGLFQAVSTRTAGTSVVNLAELHPAIQVSYLVMMYISVLPIAISVRSTNTYEEMSLGVYGKDDSSVPDNEADDKGSARSYLGNHLRRQLSFDLWFVFLGLFLICIIEGGRLQDASQPAFNIFTCMFEIISAYGTVGLSLGYPNINASFSAEFASLSKLIIIAMMLRGRHRGLPYALDRAILLPGEGLKSDKARRQSEADASAALANAERKQDEADFANAKRRRATDGSLHLGKQRSPQEKIMHFIAGALTAGPAPKKKNL
jgi:potassium uptake Trk family protein